jgi:AAA domain
LLDRPTITGETIAQSWQFVRAKIHPTGARYHFRCDRSYPVRHTKAYLARNHGGTFAQIKRRHKAIEDLKSHEALLRLLADPWSVSKTGEEKLPVAQSNISVDGTKIAALKKLWQTQPSFAIQGPPGTGKTTLIQAFADRLFGSDPTAQVLLTAHSHHTVDDVRKKIRKLFLGLSDVNAPILIRMGARQPTEDDIRPVTQKMIAKLSKSSLANDSPEFMTARLRAAAASISETNDLGLLELHTMELLVQDAANVVFATCNSADR